MTGEDENFTKVYVDSFLLRLSQPGTTYLDLVNHFINQSEDSMRVPIAMKAEGSGWVFLMCPFYYEPLVDKAKLLKEGWLGIGESKPD